MRRHVPYPKIRKLSDVYQKVSSRYLFDGYEDDGSPIYKDVNNLPTLKFTGRVKLHGANAAICYSQVNGVESERWYQTRQNIAAQPESLYGLPSFLDARSDSINKLITQAISDNNELLMDKFKNNYIISIYGEWCGSNIQKNVAITELDKMFVIFGLKASDVFDKEGPTIWLDHSNLRDNDVRIFNIDDFKKFEIDLDFKNLQASEDELLRITDEVEAECPVGKAFGVSGIGEGVVWSHRFDDGKVVRFKIKGDKHSETKKTKKKDKLSKLSPEKLDSINEFVEKHVTLNRLHSNVDKYFENGQVPLVSDFGKFLQFMKNDVFSEASDDLVASNIDASLVAGPLSKAIKELYWKEYVGI